MKLPCCPTFNIYTSLNFQITKNQSATNDSKFKDHTGMERVNSTSSDVSVDMTGSNKEQRCTIYDCQGVTEERYERMHRSTLEEHIYTGSIPRVMRDILVDMPPGMTAEDMLQMCPVHGPSQNETDDEFSDEQSYYMEGQIQ